MDIQLCRMRRNEVTKLSRVTDSHKILMRVSQENPYQSKDHFPSLGPESSKCSPPLCSWVFRSL